MPDQPYLLQIEAQPIPVLPLSQSNVVDAVGCFVVDCVDAADGRGEFVFARHPYDARPFDTARDALDYWNRVSTVVPVRPDGRPNKPLTAFTISLVRLPEPVTKKAGLVRPGDRLIGARGMTWTPKHPTAKVLLVIHSRGDDDEWWTLDLDDGEGKLLLHGHDTVVVGPKT